MSESKLVLSEFQKAIRIHTDGEIMNLDKIAHKFNFFVHRFEDVFKDTQRRVPPNKWSVHRIGLIMEGSTEFVTGIYKFKAPRNSLMVVPSRMISSSKNWSQDIKGYILLFNADFFLQNNFPARVLEDKKVLRCSLRPYIYINDTQAELLKTIFEAILDVDASGDSFKNELLALKTMELLIYCERMFSEEQQFDSNLPVMDLVKSFIDKVEESFIEERSVNYYASQLNVHPNYLNSLIKKQTGLTAKESIQNRILMEIKYLLHNTSLSIKEIAARLGFNDANYLTTFFKKAENVSPAQYRTSFI